MIPPYWSTLTPSDLQYFESIGEGEYNRTGGEWTESHLIIDWFGTYD